MAATCVPLCEGCPGSYDGLRCAHLGAGNRVILRGDSRRAARAHGTVPHRVCLLHLFHGHHPAERSDRHDEQSL